MVPFIISPISLASLFLGFPISFRKADFSFFEAGALLEAFLALLAPVHLEVH